MLDADAVKEPIVDARITKILALRTDSIAMTEALDAIGEFYVSNTADARQSLRQNLEKRTIEYGKKFLEEMESIRVRLDAVDDYSSHLYQSCKALAARVEEADRNIKSFMDQANELEAKRTMYLTQSEEVETFLSKYHLNDSEILLLQNARLDVANEARSFYTTFSKLQQAYQDCKVITEKQFYGIGFELLEVLGKHQETAYEKLFFWFKAKCEALAEDTSQLSAAQQNQYQYLYGQLQTAARLLQHVPSYVEQCQELLIDARRTSLVQAFMVVALQGIAAPAPSSASSSGSAAFAPGAVHGSGDSPVQFLGGLLAWVHQAVAIETEFYAGVTSSQRKKPATADEGVASVGSGSTNVGFSLEELVVRTVQGVGRPLRMRILQLLETHVAAWDVLYALADLLVFYQQLFARSMLQSENAINATLKGCFQECERLFQGQIRRFVESVRGQSSQYASLLPSPSGATASSSAMASTSVDLQASLWTRECAIHVKALLKSAATALSSLPHDGVPASSSSSQPPSGSGEAEATSPKAPTQSTLSIASVLGDIVTPCLQACRVAGQGLALATSEMAVFMLNNIAALQAALLDYKAATASRTALGSVASPAGVNWQEMLAQEAASWTTILVQEEVSRILQRSDLDKLVELIDALPSGLAASEQFGLDVDRVATVLRAFYASLFSTILCPQLDRISDPQRRDEIRQQITQEITGQYAKVYALVTNPSHLYGEAGQSLLQHTVDSVQLLLGNI